MKKTHSKSIIENQRNQKGFTLIELLVVISIIALLSSIVLTSLNTARQKGEDSKTIQEVDQIRTQLEIYALDHNGSYPTVTYNNPTTQYAISKDAGDESILDTLSNVFSKTAYAANGGCIKDSTGPSPDWDKIKKLDTNPVDNCIKYYSTGNTAAIFATLRTQTQSTPNGNVYNRKYGAVFGIKTADQLNTLCTQSNKYPAFGATSNNNIVCTGTTPFDTIAGMASGGNITWVVSGNGTCSDTQYTDQASCIADHSYCDDSSGRTPGEYCENECDDGGGVEQSSYTTYSACTSASTHNEYCVDSSNNAQISYTTSPDCTNAGYCSGGGFGNQTECQASSHCVDGMGTEEPYSDSATCTAATVLQTAAHCQDSGGNTQGGYGDSASCTSAGSCSGGGYTDSASCSNGRYCSGGSYGDSASCTSAGYCDDSAYGDQSSCQAAGATWYSYGYTWTQYTWSNYGYTWVPDVYVNAGYSWNSYGYTWTGYGYTWHVSDDNNNYSWNRRGAYPNWVPIPINTWTPAL